MVVASRQSWSSWAREKSTLESSAFIAISSDDGPHEKSVMHSHPNSVVVYLTDGTIKMTTPDGKSQNMTATKGKSAFTPAGTHLPENVGNAPFEAILVELKK